MVYQEWGVLQIRDGGRRNVTQEIGQIVEKTGVIIRMAFGEDAETPEIFSKKFGKSQFSIEFKQYKSFLKFFTIFFGFGTSGQNFARMFLFFHVDGN